MTQWIRVKHNGDIKFGTLSDGNIAVHTGDMFDGPSPTSESQRPCEPRVFISAAEPSADRHGAALIRAARAVRPGIRFVGVAGPRMVDEGCEPIFDMTSHAAMLTGVVRVLGKGIQLLRVVRRTLLDTPFDAAVLIDSPTLHLPLARQAKRAGVPVLYYIAPQLWAWGASRIPPCSSV